MKNTTGKFNIQILNWDKKFVMSKADKGLIYRLYKKFWTIDKGRNPPEK